ncbi:TATA-binding protein-associated factor [Tetrabaena socialis]|uniref:TATA-binding protein-associated factor n=1 Tax=Tetrabaena socialis TaxID=47790 RepID=A0A2J8A7N5_9CHLO|nr:TATA-binding protein-associated factor [Tetrabaena socialis]|eukprot:PNH08544.1 TATA-binding protein-associated factor [Tetrabaena socialis]
MATAKPQSSSRLQKLLNLLETGTSDATRKAAAKQLSEIARAHPDQVLATVQKVHAYLYHKSWETRVAAGEALAYLADIFQHHSPEDLRAHALASGADAAELAAAAGPGGPLDFSKFSLQQVLERGTPLGASGGQEFDLVLDPGLTPRARLAAQREGLKKRLGLDRDMGLDADALFGDEDLEAAEDVCLARHPHQPLHRAGSGSAGAGAAAAPKQAAAELLRGMDAEGLSARERNRLKRKAKALGLGRNDSLRSNGDRHKSSLDADGGGQAAGGGSGGAAANGEDNQAAAQGQGGGAGGAMAAAAAAAAVAAQEVADDEVAAVAEGGWPFQRLGDQLVVDSLDPVWEVRHGAALALRELLRAHAGAAAVEAPLGAVPSGWAVAGGTGKRSLGVVAPAHLAAARAANRRWLEDCIVHLLCVLALDRFGDYGSDQALEQYLHVTAAASMAAACVHSGVLPEKFNTVIQPLMNCLRREPQLRLQGVCAGGLAELLALCCARSPSPNDKLVRNIVAMATADLMAAGQQQQQPGQQPGQQGGPAVPPDFIVGAGGEEAAARMRVTAAQCMGELLAAAHVHGSAAAAPELLAALSSPSATARQFGALAACAWLAHAKQQQHHQQQQQQNGGGVHGQQQPLLLPPALLQAVLSALAAVSCSAPLTPASQEPYAELVPYYAQMRREVLALVSAALDVHVLLPLPAGVPVEAVGAEHAAALLTAAAAAGPPEGSPLAAAVGRLRGALASLQVREAVVPLLSSPDDTSRLGAVEVVSGLCCELGPALVPYAVLLLVPLLRRMSDPAEEVRAAAAGCFGSLMTLLPLAQVRGEGGGCLCVGSLLLSGTPIQNDVLEMWSLFDFLMPGFLGPEKAFRAKFGKALQESRGGKRGGREAEAGLLALEGLHRSLLPFVLRRTKGQVQDEGTRRCQAGYAEGGERSGAARPFTLRAHHALY